MTDESVLPRGLGKEGCVSPLFALVCGMLEGFTSLMRLFCYLYVDSDDVNNRDAVSQITSCLQPLSLRFLPQKKEREKKELQRLCFFHQISPHLAVFAVLRFGVLSRVISHYGFRFSFPAEAEGNRASLSSLESPSNGF